MKAGKQLSDLAISTDNVLVGVELLQTHGATGVEFLGGNPHLAAKTEFPSVGEAGRDIDIDRGGINQHGELGGVCLAPGEDGVTVTCGMLSNMSNGLIGAVHNCHGKLIPAGTPGMMAAARGSRRSSTGTRPLALRCSVSRSQRRGRKSDAIS